jgi:hypothetical protein
VAKAQKQGQDQERGQEAGTGGRRQGQEEDCADLLDLELKRGREGTLQHGPGAILEEWPVDAAGTRRSLLRPCAGSGVAKVTVGMARRAGSRKDAPGHVL